MWTGEYSIAKKFAEERGMYLFDFEIDSFRSNQIAESL